MKKVFKTLKEKTVMCTTIFTGTVFIIEVLETSHFYNKVSYGAYD